MNTESDDVADGVRDPLTQAVIGCAYDVANTLGHGFLEKVYENALAHRLRKAGLEAVQQHPINVIFDGIIVGEFCADILVNGTLIVELKFGKRTKRGAYRPMLELSSSNGHQDVFADQLRKTADRHKAIELMKFIGVYRCSSVANK